MAWLGDKIRELQNKPYQARMRALWWMVGIAVVVVILTWILTLRYRSGGEDADSSKFGEIWSSIKKVKDIKLEQQ